LAAPPYLRAALEDDGDPWRAFSDCLHRVVDGQSQALAQRVAELPGPDRGRDLRHSYLALALQALRGPAGEALPGAPADEGDLSARWRPAA